MTKNDTHSKNQKADAEKAEQDSQQEFEFEPASEGTVRIKWILGLTVLLVGAIAAGVYWNQAIKVNSVSISGHQLADTADISQRVQFALGQKRDSVNMLRVIDTVEKATYVRNANVSVDLYGTLDIHIDERVPAALLADQSQKMWVDYDGVILPLRLGSSVNVPLLYGFGMNSRTDTLKSDAFKTVSTFLSSARQHDFTWSTLSEVMYDDTRGIIAVSDEQGVRLIFGKKDFARKMNYWKAFYGQVMQHKQLEDQQEIDLRYEGQIVTR